MDDVHRLFKYAKRKGRKHKDEDLQMLVSYCVANSIEIEGHTCHARTIIKHGLRKYSPSQIIERARILYNGDSEFNKENDVWLSQQVAAYFKQEGKLGEGITDIAASIGLGAFALIDYKALTVPRFAEYIPPEFDLPLFTAGCTAAVIGTYFLARGATRIVRYITSGHTADVRRAERHFNTLDDVMKAP